MRVKKEPDKQSELWATCPCDCLLEVSLQKKRGSECAFRVFGSAEMDYPSKREEGWREQVSQKNCQKSKEENNEVTEMLSSRRGRSYEKS